MKRNTGLYGALAATLLVTAWLALQPAAEPEPAVALPTRPASPDRSAVARAPTPSAAGPSRPGAAGTESPLTTRPAEPPASSAEVRTRSAWGPLSSESLAAWSPPEPPPPPTKPVNAPVGPPPPPPKPPTPAFPYKWIGQLIDSSGPIALLDSPQRSTGARAGDVLDGRWRIDKVTDGQIDLTWLPTNEPVTVRSR
jgi:hypothetical protein